MLLQQTDAPHHRHPRRLAAACQPVGVVQVLRAIDGDAYEEMVGFEKLTPLIGEQRSVGLQTVVDMVPPRITPLKRQCLLVEGDGAQQRFAAMPREEHLMLRLCLDILACEQLQQVVAHHGIMGTGLQIIAVAASQVALAAGWLQHDVERLGEGLGYIHITLYGVRLV